MSTERLTLVLNASYVAINIVAARRAIKLVMKGAAVVEVPSAYSIRTARMSFPVPSVVRLREYRHIPRVSRSVSRKNILLRDRHTCQYCGTVSAPKMLTLDHVMPVSRGGGASWENLVASCLRCNNKKANRTPAEAGMPLPRKPVQIGIHSKHRLMATDKEWDKYLFV